MVVALLLQQILHKMNKITLKINDKELEFSFGLAFLGELIEKTDLSLEDIIAKMNKNPFKMVPMIMFYSASYALERKGKEVDFTRFDISDWIDTSGGIADKSVVKFIEAFTLSLTKGVPKEEEAAKKDDSPKKK